MGKKMDELDFDTKSSLQLSKVDMKDTEHPYIEVEISDGREEAAHCIVMKDCTNEHSFSKELSEKTIQVKIEGDEYHYKTLQHDVLSTGNKMCDICQSGKNIGSNASTQYSGNGLQDLICTCGKKSSSAITEKDRKGNEKEKRYRCLKCNKTFKQLNHLKMHKRVHTAKHSLQCEICSLTLKHKSNLKLHMKKHLGEKDFSCDLCSTSFYSKYELNIHTLKHKGERPHECTVCGDKFPVASRLKRHMTIHTGERPFQCEVCGIVFREQYTLVTHMGVHLSRGPYSCDICGEEFSRLNWLTLHQKVHKTNCTYSYAPQKNNKKDDSFVSTTCKSTISSSFLNSPHEESELKLESCGVEMNLEKMNDNSDNEICATKSKQPLSCTSDMTGVRLDQEKCTSDIYSANVPHPSIIQEALSTGTVLESQGDDGKGYLIVFPKSLAERNCTLYTVCPPTANKSQGIEDHNTSRKGKEKLQSNYNLFDCDNSLDSLPDISMHSEQEILIEAPLPKSKKPKKKVSNDMIENKLLVKRIEKTTKRKPKKIKQTTVSKLHRCYQCGKDYKTSSNLKLHMRTHTGERPYYCDFCGMGFKQLAHLQAHVRLHTGSKPYSCDLCNKAFHQSSRLRYHIQTTHVKGKKNTKVAKQLLVRNFYCKICDRTFINSCYKTDHMKSHINNIKDEIVEKNSKEKVDAKKDHEEKDPEGICELCGFQYKNLVALQSHRKLVHKVSESVIQAADVLEVVSTDAAKRNLKGNLSFSTEKDGHSPIGSLALSTEKDKNKSPAATVPEESVFSIKALESGKYQCSACCKTFSTRSNARVHLRLHTDARPYKCNDCGKTFRQISHLKDHAKMHRGEKPFSCSICHADFTQSSGIKVHIKKYHQDQAYVINKYQGSAYAINKNMDDIRQDSITFELESDSDDNALIICVGDD